VVETDRMISEKIVVLSAAHDAATRTPTEGLGIYGAARRPAGRCVSAWSSGEICATGRAMLS
jgi:hypothetical protein